jgi:alanine racemase
MELFDLCKWRPELLSIDQVAIDSRWITSPKALFVALKGVHVDGHDFVEEAIKKGAQYCLVKKDALLPLSKNRLLQVDDPLRALQQISALYRRERKAKVVAICGSCGKTMLKDLLLQLVGHEYCFASPGSFNSQLGAALSLLQIQKSDTLALIEAGISEVGEMELLGQMIQPDHVIITNTGKARLGSYEKGDIRSKEIAKILEFVPQGNWCLVPKSLSKKPEWHSLEMKNPHFPHVKKISPLGTYEILFPSGFSIQKTFSENFSYLEELLSIAVQASFLLGVGEKQIAARLLHYVPEPMRTEVWTTNGITYINDTYAAEPMACDVALKQFEILEDFSNKRAGRKIFLFDGLRKYSGIFNEIDAAKLGASLASHKVDLAVLVKGPLAELIQTHLATLSKKTKVLLFDELYQGIDFVKKHAESTDVVLIKGQRKLPYNEVLQIVEESPPNNQVIINLAAIESNIEQIRLQASQNVRIMVMVKALAYGTDDIRIAKFLKSCQVDILGVSYVDEGVSMRRAGVVQNIFVLNAAEYEAAKAVKWNLEIAVSDAQLIEVLQMHAKNAGKKMKVHLHINTGMNRFGCHPKEALFLAKKIQSSSHLLLEGVMTHFASADEPLHDSFTLQQSALFDDTISAIEQANIPIAWRHACNSSAAIRFGFPQYNMIRIGLAAYGLHASPFSHSMMPLRPAISLVSRIVGINSCSSGDTISYGRTYRVEKERAKVAVLPIGYYDGLHRNYSGKGFVMIHGKKAPMCGKICMDYMMCDISDIPEAKVGDQAVLFGEGDDGYYLPPEELAERGGSIVHELLTCLGPRIRRCFIYDESLRSR